MGRVIASDDLRVPVAALPAEVRLVGDVVLSGRIFVPVAAPSHGGPARADEWVNDPGQFFPFLRDGTDRPELLNKHAVIAIDVPAWTDEPDPEVAVNAPQQEVVIECGGLSFRGRLELEAPEHRARVLDLLNLSSAFITVRAGERHYLVHKRHITRVVEEGGG